MYASFGIKEYRLHKYESLYCSLCQKKIEESYCHSYYCQHGRLYTSFYLCEKCYKQKDFKKEWNKLTKLHFAMGDLVQLEQEDIWFSNGDLRNILIDKNVKENL